MTDASKPETILFTKASLEHRRMLRGTDFVAAIMTQASSSGKPRRSQESEQKARTFRQAECGRTNRADCRTGG
ncbi:hypothetical protein ONR75_31370 [Rhodopseudomonas sp. P2A-2r]|uniref:hypothetical protein n=1 Tax=Rhodopseudomonas sp. P2A-2r TaxID=2991972 RepID=UPI002233F30D|nr:hypothetical protein [Rhodopseudomonas sp. P2A-2r]UZE52415.1 hypothetical protein ONR75_31370 [Rhodopseudomonas sp. P2A-2r]